MFTLAAVLPHQLPSAPPTVRRLPICRCWYLLPLVLLLYALPLTAQPLDLSLMEGSTHLVATPHMQVFKSKEQLSIGQVLQPGIQSQFVLSVNKPVVFAGYDPNFYWFRMVLKNGHPAPRDLLLLMGPIGMREGLLYRVKNNRYQLLGKNGVAIPFTQRAYPYTHYAYPLRLEAQNIDTFYLSMDARHVYKSYAFALLQPGEFKIFANRMYLLFGIILGILFLFLIFNLYLYTSLNDRIHLWYSLYILLLMLIVMKNDQLDQQFLGWDFEQAYRLTPIMALGAFAISVLMHVVQQFLTNIARKSRLGIFLDAVKYNTFLSALCHLVAFNLRPEPWLETLLFKWANISTMVTILAIIGACIYSTVRGLKSAIFVLAGLLLFLIGALQRLTLAATVSYLFPPSTFHLGMIMETLVISFGLIYRYRAERNEKMQYLADREALRNNFDKLLLESKFEIQEQTLRNIGQEIHDNIGQVLSLVRMNLTRQTMNLPSGPEQKMLDDQVTLIGKAIADLRLLSKLLDADYVLEMGLVKSISSELDQVRKYGAFETALTVEGDELYLEPQKELILFRLFQEVLQNIIKHAQAQKVWVALSVSEQQFSLIIRDDGVGFDPEAMLQKGNGKGMGLKNMYRRAGLLQAAFRISSGEEGTTVSIALPTQKVQEPVC